MSSSVEVSKGPVDVAVVGEAEETLRRFRDMRDDERRRLGYEVTNQDMLDMLMDVFALHREADE